MEDKHVFLTPSWKEVSSSWKPVECDSDSCAVPPLKNRICTRITGKPSRLWYMMKYDVMPLTFFIIIDKIYPVWCAAILYSLVFRLAGDRHWKYDPLPLFLLHQSILKLAYTIFIIYIVGDIFLKDKIADVTLWCISLIGYFVWLYIRCAMNNFSLFLPFCFKHFDSLCYFNMFQIYPDIFEEWR